VFLFAFLLRKRVYRRS